MVSRCLNPQIRLLKREYKQEKNMLNILRKLCHEIIVNYGDIWNNIITLVVP
jgi:hypothetical protein